MTVAQYIDDQAPELQEELWSFHHFILQAHPAIRATLKYGVPFYVLKKNLCYLCVQKNKVVLGIVDAYLQPSIFDLVDFTGRKQIGHFIWNKPDDQCYTDLQRVLTEAIEFDLRRRGKV